jgi:hypothetical protein
METAVGIIPAPIKRIPCGGAVYHLCVHPERVMLPHIEAWVQEYEYTEHYRVPVAWTERHACWVECRDIWRLIHGKND